MPLLLTQRPHAKTVDFRASRFVVSTGAGMRIFGKAFERGDEIPVGLVNERALRSEYEPPLRRIELLEYAATIPELREACARRGVVIEAAPAGSCVIAPASRPKATVAPAPPADPKQGNAASSQASQSGSAAPARAGTSTVDVDSMSRIQMIEFCERHALSFNTNTMALRKRIQKFLADGIKE